MNVKTQMHIVWFTFIAVIVLFMGLLHTSDVIIDLHKQIEALELKHGVVVDEK